MRKLVRFILVVGIVLFVGGMLYISYLSYQNDDINFNLILVNSDLTLQKDSNYQLDYVVYPLNTNYGDLIFTSSDEKILEVNEVTGYIEAKKAGTAYIKAYLDKTKETKYCKVTVVDKISKTSFKTTSYYMDLGDEYYLDYYKKSSNINFTSSNEMVALVEDGGLVKPIATGTTTITLSDGNNTSTVLLTVGDNISNTTVTESTTDALLAIVDKTKKFKTVTYNVGDTFNLQNLVESIITIDSDTTVKVDGKTITYNDGMVKIIEQGSSKINIENSNCRLVLTVKCKKVVEETNSNDEEDEDIDNNDPSSIKIIGYDTYNYYYGDTLKLSYTVFPSTASTNVTWISSDNNIAKVDNGNVNFVGTGNVTIKVLYNNNVYDNVTFNVTNKEPVVIPVDSISINGPSSLNVNSSYNYTVTVNPSNATNKNVSWSVDNSSIASINQNGTLKGLKAGKVVLTCKVDGVSKSMVVQINSVSNDSPSPTPTPVSYTVNITGNTSCYVGESINLTANVSPSTSNIITWSSSNTSIATVSNGKVNGIKSGKVVITASVNGFSGTYNVEIKVKDTTVNVDSISLNKISLTLDINGTFNLVTTINPSNATNKTITYSSSDSSIISVDGAGKINALKAGTATITAKSNNGKTATCTVTVNKPVELDKCDTLVQVNKVTSIDYKDFTEYKKNSDDFYVAKAAHECANKYNLPVSVTKDTYNFYNSNNEESILVKTNTNFNDSTIIIHDEKMNKMITNFKLSDMVPMFSISVDEETNLQKTIKGTTFTKDNNYNATLAGKNYIVILENKNIVEFHRKHDDDTQKEALHEVLVYMNGTRTNSMLHDSLTVTSSTIREIPSTTLTFKNLNFKIYCNTSNSLASYGGYANRGILVTRSNTKISDVDFRYYNKDGTTEAPTMYYAYRFIRISGTYNVTYEKSKVSAFRNYNASNVKNSSYGFSLGSNVNLKFYKLKMATSTMMSDANVWGITGTSHNENWVIDNCEINRVDAHKGVNNLTVTNSTLGAWGIHVTGYGTMTLENNTFKYTNQIVNLRPDYGAFWNGTIKIKDCVWEPNSTNLSIVATSFVNNFDFGYSLYYPNVEINNLTIKKNITAIPVYNVTEANYKSFKTQYANVAHYKNTADTKRTVTALAVGNYTYKDIKNSSGGIVVLRVWK